jgi:sugar phosphate permease
LRYRWAVLGAGTAAQTAFSAVIVGLPVLAPALRDEFDLTLSQVGIALSSVWVGPVVTLLPWGLLADRFGERFVLASGLALCGALLLVAGVASNFLALVVLLGLAGAAGASVNAASARAVMQWFAPEERGLALGIRQTAIPIGGGLAAIALPIADHAGGLQAAFGVLTGLCFAGAAAAALVVREARVRDAELEGAAVPWTLRDTRLWTLCLGSGLYLVAQLAITAFLVLFLHDDHGVSEGAAAGALAVLQLAAVITRISAGRLSDLMGSRLRPLRWIGILSAAGLAATALVADGSVPVVVTVLVLAGAVSMAWNGLSVAAAAELAGRARSGAAIGFQQTTLGVVGVIVPALFASVVEETSYRVGFALAALGPLAGWWLLGRLSEPARRPDSVPETIRSS